MSGSAAAPEFLTTGSAPTDYVRVINQLQTELFQLRGMIQGPNLNPQGNAGGGGGEARELTRWRSIQALPKFDGDEKAFKDFDFKLHQFVRPVIGFEKILHWVKDQEIEPNHERMEAYKQETGLQLE